MCDNLLIIGRVPFPRPILRIGVVFCVVNNVVNVDTFVLTTEKNRDGFALLPWDVKEVVTD